MRPRLIATDLDGTLLRSDGSVSERTAAALLAAEGAGIVVVFVTGRPLRWAREVFVHVGGHGLAIVSNAALVWDVAADSPAQMRAIAESLEGQLTATLLLDEQDVEIAAGLLPILERKVGRILANGFPTGVEVTSAMVHGGPFPATSDGRSTSVGTAAISRFLRPVCYQNLPQALLPAVLKDDNTAGVWRRRDGALGKT